jgi:hypothetical protein
MLKDVGMRNEASQNPSVIHLVIRPVHPSRHGLFTPGGGENSGVETRRMLKPDLDSESV